MSTNIYSESQFSEQSAINQLQNLGYKYFDGNKEFNKWISQLGRKNKSNVILQDRLFQQLKKLNPQIEEIVLQKVVSELDNFTQTALSSGTSLFNLNKSFYNYLKEGFTTIIDKKHKKINLIDWQNISNNDFLIVNQFKVLGIYWLIKIPDLVLFVNGIPLVIFEFKRPENELLEAYEKNLKDYKYTIPQLFVPNAFLVISNWVRARAWSTFATYEFFKLYNKITKEDENLAENLENLINVLFPQSRFLDIVENFILFGNDGKTKILAQNHQFIGVNKAFEKIKTWKQKLGVFWHTQWSGKSFSMVFLSQKVMRKLPGNWTFLVVTDRKELDKQIYKTFTEFGINTEPNVRAQTISHLKELLQQNHKFIFTLIHKFQEIIEPINKRDDIIVMVDEAHRTQYWELALNMRVALPNAKYIAFTWTPLLKGDKITRNVFGDYISIYNFSAAIKDKATVPIFYENRKPKLKLDNPDLDEQVQKIFDEYWLEEEEEEKLVKKLGSMYQILTSEERLKKVAHDIVYDYFFRPDDFKAMVVTIDKPTAYRMYFLIKNEIEKLKHELETKLREKTITDKEKIALEKIKKFDFAVMVSLGKTQWELEKVQKYWIDPTFLIKRIQTEDLEEKFKNPDSNLKMIIVVWMWITGFDVPNLRVLYLDRPMRDHTLMQTIARTNRRFKGKENGIIVDYIGLYSHLREALKDYASSQGELPAKDITQLVEQLKSYIVEFNDILKEIVGVNLDDIKDISKDIYKFSDLTEKDKQKIKILANKIISVYKSLLPHSSAVQFIDDLKKIKILLTFISEFKPLDIDSLKLQLEQLINQSLKSDSFIISDYRVSKDLLEIVNRNFENSFEKEVEKTKTLKQNEKNLQIQSLREYLLSRLKQLSSKTTQAVEFKKRLQQLIDRYNTNGDLEELLEWFKKLHQQITEKEKEFIESNLTPEEFKLFEKLSQDFKISNKKKLQDLAKQLYDKIKSILDIHAETWKQQETIRSKLKTEIKKEMIKFCNDINDTRCKSLLRKLVDNVFDYVLEEY